MRGTSYPEWPFEDQIVGLYTDRPDRHIIELGLVEKEEARVLAKAKRAKLDAAAAVEKEKEERARDVGMDVDMWIW